MRKIIIALSLCALFLTGCAQSYEKAYQKTDALKSYTMEIDTEVECVEGGEIRSEKLTQTVSAENVAKKNMIYTVRTDKDGKETGRYTYFDGNYYIEMPGIKYYSPVDFESAEKTIVDLTDIISLPYDKMYNVVKNGDRYDYNVEGEDVSEYVNALLQTAANSFGEKDFKAEKIVASAVVDGKYVTERNFEAVYASDDGNDGFSVAVHTKITDKKANVEKPDISQYANISD